MECVHIAVPAVEPVAVLAVTGWLSAFFIPFSHGSTVTLPRPLVKFEKPSDESVNF